MNQAYTFKLEEKKLSNLKLETKLLAPFLPGHLIIDGEYKKNYLRYSVDGDLAKHHIVSALDIKLNEKSEGNYDVAGTVTVNKHNAKLHLSRIIQNEKSEIKNLLTISCGTKIELNGHFNNHPSDQNADMHFTGLLLLAEKEVPYG